MLNLLKGRKHKMGMPAGSLIHVGDKTTEDVHITLIDYNETEFTELEIKDLDDCKAFIDTPNVTWLHVTGIHDTAIIQKIGDLFNLHPLILEDILNTSHRPKIEDYDEYLFTLVKYIQYDDERDEADIDQMSLVLSNNFLITFDEQPFNAINNIKQRIKNKNSRLRKMGDEYLYYAIMDITIDQNFIILEKIGERISDIEDEVITKPKSETLHAIHRLKREMIYLRKSIWPLREIIRFLQRSESPLIAKTIRPFLKDLYDHTIQIIDTIETFRDMLSVMLDIYLSSVNNRMNDVMKVLTIISTIFIPLSFIAGIYGMNFRHMPELTWPFGYPIILGIMFFAGLLMVLYFRRKKWL